MTGTDNKLTGKLTKLSPNECLELLSTATVGRIAYVDSEGQQLVPVNFVVTEGLIYLRTRTDGFLSELWSGHDDIAFEADRHEDSSHDGWNVTVRGSVSKVQDRATINRALADPNLRPWAGGVRSTVLAIKPRFVEGRKVAESSPVRG